MRIQRNRDNKIKIPWYRRRVPIRRIEQFDYTPPDFGFMRVPEPVPQPVPKPVPQPATVPVPETGRVPIPVPSPVPDSIPGVQGIPLPGRPFPVPVPVPEKKRQEPTPVPEFPLGIDWEAHYRRIAKQYEQTMQGRPEPMSVNPRVKSFEMIVKPIIYLTVGKDMLERYVEAKITDPIYAKMLETPVLGNALRAAERAGMSVEALANYFANYDWDNMNINEMLKDLTLIVGAGGAARIIMFFIGQKVVFRI